MSSDRLGCFLDIYHLKILLANLSSYNHLEIEGIRNMQNNYIDLFHLIFSVVGFMLSGYFYTRIILFLKLHEKKIFKKVDTTEQNNPIQAFAVTLNQTEETNTGLTQNTGPIPVAPIVVTTAVALAPLEDETCVAIPTNNVVAATTKDETAVERRDSEATQMIMINRFVVHTDNSTVGILEKEYFKIEGDICCMTTNKNTKVKSKRRLEVKTAKKTFILTIAFLSCRICYLIAILVRQIYSQSPQVLRLKANIEIFLILASYLSCFFNSFTFILVTDFFKMKAIKYMQLIRQKVNEFLFNCFRMTVDKEKIDMT
jgi:hypothetical protein